MIREKIFRLHRHTRSSFTLSSPSPSPASHKILFSFSSIQALQVPKGWDKLVVSLISTESGKTVCKSGKVQVKNGSCQWTETLSESIWISDVNSSKDLDKHLHKFLVSTGSSRSGVLGDATLNLAAFMSLESPVLVSLPLKNCNSGTILQLEVTCLTPKIDFSFSIKGEDPDEPDHLDNSSEVESYNSNNSGSLSRPSELAVKDTCFSPSISWYSFDSTENVNGRQDSIESNDSESYNSSSTHWKSVRSIQGPFAREKQDKNQRQGFGELSQTDALSLQKNGSSSSSGSSSQRFTGDSTVQELEAEARMWERNARKLSVDLETMRKDMSDQNLTVANLNIELSASRSNCQKLTQEIEHLKSEIREMGESNNIRRELEYEMQFLKEQNENLSMQLRKTQDSNIKLIYLLREMEEAAEKQNLASLKSENDCRHEDSDEERVIDQVPTSEETDAKASETNILEHFARENNCSLELELLNLQDSLQTCQNKISVLESKLEDRIIETEVEQDLTNHIIKRYLVNCNHRLEDKEEQIMNLEAALSEALHDGHFNDGQQIELLNKKASELETDCDEPGKSPNDDEPISGVQYLRNEMPDDNSTVVEANEDSMQKEKYIKASSDCQEVMERDCIISTSDCFSRSVSGTVLYSNSSSSISSHTTDNSVEEIRLLEAENINAQWAKHVTELEEENIYLVERVSGLEAQLRYLVDAKESNRLELQHLEYQVMILQDQVRRLEEEIQARELDAKQKLRGMEERWLETREECESLGKLNVKLQTTTETLAEECSLLQKLVGELKEQKLKLEDQCMFLETEARKYPDDCSSCAENITNPVIDEIESKLKDSELSRLRSEEENLVLRMQLQRVPELQNEVLRLRVSLKEMKSQTQLLKASLKSLSEENEELKHEQVSMAQKISCLSKAVSEAEDCWHKKIALEEKILRLEGDLIARDQLCAQDAEMRHDLSQTKILNSQLAMKVKHLEEVRAHLQCELQSYEGRLKQAQHAEESHRNATSESQPPDSYPLGNELDEGPDANGPSKLQDESTRAVVSMESDSKEIADTAKAEQTLLEAELKEIRERYLQMSLKYAEVEAQREQLVMKLKALRSQSSFSLR